MIANSLHFMPLVNTIREIYEGLVDGGNIRVNGLRTSRVLAKAGRN